jgi:hypothetical protein
MGFEPALEVTLAWTAVESATCGGEVVGACMALQVWVRVPAAPQAAQVDKGNGKAQEGVAEAEEPERVMDVASGLARADPYVWWHQFRTICDNHAALGVCLELTAELPASELLRRWMGEPLKVRRSASLLCARV